MLHLVIIKLIKIEDIRNTQHRYDEPQYLADIEEHLGVTIQQADIDMKVKADEFDGKVVYGEKKKEGGAGYAGHRSELAPTLATLTSLETQAGFFLVFLRSKKSLSRGG